MAASSISDFLLVPFEVQAAIVNDQVRAGVTFFNGQYQYEQVPRFLTPAPPPFTNGGNTDKGVHLHWELPAAFRQGTSTGDNKPIEFPYVPNRWLVLRYWPGQSAADRQVKASVLLSDHIGNDGTNSFLDPTAATPTPTKLGKSVSLADFTEPANQLFLKGVAPGNVTFSTYRVNAQNVFSFLDDVSDITLSANETVYLSYLIVGWYSDPTHDPLSGLTDAAAWAEKTAGLKWATNVSPYAVAGASPPQKAFGVKGYGDLSGQFPPGSQFTVTGSKTNNGTYKVAASGPVWDSTDSHMTIAVEAAMPTSDADGYIVAAGAPSSWPTQSLAHGLLYNVAWQNFELPPRPNSTHDEISANVKLAVGNSAIDALAAMIVNEAKTNEGESDSAALADATALEAFQTNMMAELEKPGGQAQLDKQLRSAWFGTDDGGTIWSIVTNPDFTSDEKFPPNSDQEAWLAQLNYFQQGLDRETRVLESMQYDLYALWWRTQSIDVGSYTKPLAVIQNIWEKMKGAITANLPTEAAAVDAQIANVAAWQARITALQAKPPSYKTTDAKTTVSIQSPPPPYTITAVDAGSKSFTVAAASSLSAFFPKQGKLVVAGSADNDGTYTIASTSFDQGAGTFTVVVTESMPSSRAGGTISPSVVPALLLKASKMPRFFEPVDPVVLVSGLGASINQTNQAKAGQDSLPCRLGSQYISAVKVDDGEIAASSLSARVATANSQNLPPGVQSASVTLELESILLDPDNASLIAAASGKPESDIAAAIRAGKDYTGVPPDPIAAAQWQQAWVPLFLDWQVTWYPTVSAPQIEPGNGPQWRFDREGWKFNGLDYDWTGGDVSTPTFGADNVSYTIDSVNTSAKSYTIAGVGNIGWQFIPKAEFKISGNSGTFTVESTTCDAKGNFTITVSETVAASQAGQTITLQVLTGGQITYSGRTFLTPKATFNFRSRLEQYVKTHGGRYSIAAADPGTKSFAAHTDADLSKFFEPGATFYVAQSTANNGTYTVHSRTYDAGTKTFTVVATQAVPSTTADGVLVSQPLADVAHLIDIIGGARFEVIGADSIEKTFTVKTEVDLNHLFEKDSSFDIAESPHNNGTYTVASTSYDEAGNSFTVVTNEPVPDSKPGGVAVPEPQEWDLLSQSLSGFTQQLLMRDLEPNQTASGTVASGTAQRKNYSDLVGEEDHTLPMLTLGDASQPELGQPKPYYFPMRGGFFALFNLALVDRFGQKIDLLFANGNNQAANPQDAWKSFAPYRSRWVTPETETNMTHPSRLIKLPPRASQAGRLEFRFVSAPDKDGGAIPPDTDIDLVGGANPVAGWILPNHLDNGLLIYDADGSALGELVLSRRGGTPPTTVVWFPTPMVENPITNPTDPTNGIPNQYLREFVGGILGIDPSKRGDAFANFLRAVDETLWAVDPLGGRSDQNLSVLVGRPLALVRSRLKLVTDGSPTVDQSTHYQAPFPRPVSEVDTSAKSFSLAMTANIADSGQYQPGATLTIDGSTKNDGVYHIVNTGYDGSKFTVYVAETIPGSTADGNLIAAPPQGGLTSTPFTLRLGRADLFDDGLIGYYVGNDYSKCYNVHALQDFDPAGYLYPIGQDGKNYLSIAYYAESTQGGPPATPVPAADPHSIFVTMLVDPRGTINASTGVLPTEELTLPAKFYEEPVSKLDLYFRTGPLMVDPEAIRLPRPAEKNGTWSWIQKNDPSNTPAAWEADPISPSNGQARFPDDPLQLRDGWLKLTGADLEQ